MPIVNGQPQQLTQTLKELIEDNKRRQVLGNAGRDYVQKYHDVKCIIDQCLDLYQDSK